MDFHFLLAVRAAFKADYKTDANSLSLYYLKSARPFPSFSSALARSVPEYCVTALFVYFLVSEQVCFIFFVFFIAGLLRNLLQHTPLPL